jgi:hypothetical protein
MVNKIILYIIICRGMSNAICSNKCYLLISRPMTTPKKTQSGKPWLLRNIPEDFRHRAKVAAAVERKSLRDFVVDVLEAYFKEMEKKGVLPKAK